MIRWVFFNIRIYWLASSFSRIYNLLLLALSYVFTLLQNRVVAKGLPMAVNIEPINLCNLKCTECPTGLDTLTRPKGQVSLSKLSSYIDQIKKTAWFVNLYFQGEPLMHAGFAEIVKVAKRAKLITSTSTNAHYLSYNQALKIVESGLDFMIISFDGLTQDVYEKYRVGGDIDKVYEGIKNLVKAKQVLKTRTPLLIGQFLAFKHNEHQMHSFKVKALGLGMDKAEVKTAQIYNVAHKKDLLPTQGSLSRYQILANGKVELKGKVKNRCWKHWSSCVITWDGRVVPCCFDKNAKYSFGNVNNELLPVVWKNDTFTLFRKNVITAQKEIDICRNCPISRK